jgi:hypothetical protein
MNNFDKGIWVTKDGRQIPVVDLESDHLINVWNMMVIRLKPLISDMQCWEYILGPRPNGEAANDAFDWEFNQALNGDLVTLEDIIKYPIMNHLYQETQKRGLDVGI